jgi:hypothetical protein
MEMEHSSSKDGEHNYMFSEGKMKWKSEVNLKIYKNNDKLNNTLLF